MSDLINKKKQICRKLFNTVIDMLTTLIHSTLVSDSQTEKGEENRKHYQNLIKKLKKVTIISYYFLHIIFKKQCFN